MLSTFILAFAAAAAVHGAPTRRSASGADPNKAVVIQMFEWDWDSVAQECRQFIRPAGYGYVQVSPAAEHIQGDQWWTSYQQVSFKLQSKRGSRDQFAAMVSACNNAGVGVLVDVLWNDMAGYDSGTGVAGSSFTHYNYPGIFDENDFHYCGLPGNDISDYNNAFQVQNCELSNLADLKTESDKVRSTLAAYGNDLLSLGVAGFRVDAAKHIPLSDLQAIIGKLNKSPIIISETVGAGPPIPPELYGAIGDSLVSGYYEALKAAFDGSSGGIAGLQNLKDQFGPASDAAMVTVATHDAERWATALRWTDGALYKLAHVFMLTYPYGHTPTILSSYSFTSQDNGAPNSGAGSCDGSSGFLCQHRYPEAARVVPFRNALVGADLNSWQSAGAARIAFGRGSGGFVVINNDDSAWSASLGTQLPDGAYCELIGGGKSGSSCAGETLNVSGGNIQINVPARSAAVVYTSAKL